MLIPENFQDQSGFELGTSSLPIVTLATCPGWQWSVLIFVVRSYMSISDMLLYMYVHSGYQQIDCEGFSRDIANAREIIPQRL